jgi:hypothetical protein
MQLSVALQLNTGGGSDDNLKVDFLGIDAVGWRSMYFVVMPGLNLTIFIISCICIVMPFSICQLPDCNLFTQHAFILWERHL